MFVDSVNGRVLTVTAPLAVGPYNWLNGLRFDAQGRLVVTTVNPVFNTQNGLPFDSLGNLCVTTA